jgi:carboxypeptidase Taq
MGKHQAPDSLALLKRLLAQVSDLQTARAVLEWDHQVMMPEGGAEARADHLTTLEALQHDLFTSDEIGRLLEELRPLEESLPHDDLDACLIRVTRRDWDKATRVPTELAAEIAHVTAEAHHVWVTARAESDYGSFRPWLDRILELKLRYLACFPPADEPYDVFLDDFEPGMKTAEVRTVFDRLKPSLIELVGNARDVAPEPFAGGPFSQEAQHALSLELMQAFGAEPSAFRLDPSVHPFCTSFSVTDVRLTTRYAEDDLTGHSLFSTMHEAGHGLYEHGVDPQLARSPLAHGCSSALHESQSRLWENVVGRSLPFWRWFYPRMQAAHADVLGDVSLERFHRAVNGVRPGFIRVDADETSYGLHIILRFELEQELLSGRLSTADLPEAWNTRFQEYLGLTVPEDRLGCLQDVHWSFGGFGYFPTYQLGNVISVQIWERLREDVGDTDEMIERGDFAAIYEWLREHLYALGSRFDPAETIERVAGGPIDPEPYLRYLQQKFGSPVTA